MTHMLFTTSMYAFKMKFKALQDPMESSEYVLTNESWEYGALIQVLALKC